MSFKALILFVLFPFIASAQNIITYLSGNTATVRPIKSEDNKVIGLDLGQGRTVEYGYAESAETFKDLVYPKGSIVKKTFHGFKNTKSKGTYTPKDKEFFFGVLDELYSDIKYVESLDMVFTRYFSQSKVNKKNLPIRFQSFEPIWSKLGSFTRSTLLKAQFSYDIYGIANAGVGQQDILKPFNKITSEQALLEAEKIFNQEQEKLAVMALSEAMPIDPFLQSALKEDLGQKIGKCNPGVLKAAEVKIDGGFLYNSKDLSNSPFVVNTVMPDEQSSFKDKIFVRWDIYNLIIQHKQDVESVESNGEPAIDTLRLDANFVAILGQSYLSRHIETRKKYVLNISQSLATPSSSFSVPEQLKGMIIERIINPIKQVQFNTAYGYLIDAIPCAL